MIRRVLAAILIVGVAAVLAALAWPQLFRLEWDPIIAQVVSLRGAAVAIGAASLVVFALLAAASVTVRRLAGSLALLMLVFCAVNLAVLSTRGFGDPASASASASEKSGDLTILAWNTLGDAPGADAIARLAIDSGADVVALPETTEATGIAVAELMRDAGRPMWVHTTAFDEELKATSTTLLISPDLGTYDVENDVGNTSTLPTVVATPTNGVGPTIAAVHPVAPVPGEMANWRSDLTWLAGLCSAPNTILAGDFNSTLDHYGRLAAPGADFGECTDAASATGNAAVGTWPADVPPLLGTPIDHVMATPDWTATGMLVVETYDDAGSDHRPIVVQLSRTG